MTAPIRLAVVGLGAIAVKDHLPAIAANADVELAACISRPGDDCGHAPFFTSLGALASSGIGVDAVSICTPPQVRAALAAEAIDAGWHVFLEKPPAATLSEAAALRQRALDRGVSLFASWHSRHAAGVAPAKAMLADRTIERVEIVWREDVRRWHPGQDWIWSPGGLGVFDAGINALSIVGWILPRPIYVETASLDVPVNVTAPIAARMGMRIDGGGVIEADFDFRQEGVQTWQIIVETDAGIVTLSDGASVCTVDAEPPAASPVGLGKEYSALYRRFVDLVRRGESDVDLGPLRLVADAFLRAEIHPVEPFHDRILSPRMDAEPVR